jgi:hypothetical protein
MKVSEDNAEPVKSPSDGQDETTGLPGLRTWRDVYLFVFACFALSVLLLLVLTMSYS